MALNLGDGILRILGDTSDVEKKVGGLRGRLNGLFGTAGRMALVGAAGAITATAGAAVYGAKSFASFDQAMTESTAIMDGITTDVRKRMEGTARDVAKTTTFSASEAASAYFYLASAGLDAEQSIAALPQVARFAQAGNFDLATATDLLTDAQSALGLSVDDTSENMKNMVGLSDMLVKANTLSNATVSQFSESLTNKAGAALRLLNKDTAEGVAVLAAFADQGVKGTQAGEKLNIVLRDLQTAAMKEKDAFREAGIAVFDANGKMRNMADIVDDLTGHLDGMSDEQKRAALMTLGFQDRSVAAMQQLLGTGDAIREYESALSDAGGTTDRVANNQLQSFNNKLSITWSKLTDLAMVLGGPIIDALGRGLDGLNGWLDGFGKVEGALNPIQPLLDGIASVMAGGSWVSFASALGLPLDAIRKIRDGLSGLETALSEVGSFIQTTAQTIIDALRPVVEQYLAYAARQFERLIELAGLVAQAFATFWPQIQEIITSVFTVIGEAITLFSTTILPVLLEWAESVVQWFIDNWPLIQDVLQVALNIAQFVIEGFIVMFQLLLSAVENIWPAIQVIIETVMGVIAGIIEAVMAIITGDWGRAWDAILGIFVTIWDGIVAFIGTIPQLILGILQGLLAAVMVWAGGFAGKLLGWAGKFLGRFVGWFARLPGRIMNAIASLLGKVLGFLGNLGRQAGSTMGRGIGRIIGWFKKLPGKAMDAVASLPGKLLGFIRDIPGKLWNSVLNIGKSIMDGIIKGITNMVGKAVDAVTGAVGSVVEGALGFLGISSPSKVFAEIGQHSMAGLAEGLGDPREPMKAVARSLGDITNLGDQLSLSAAGASASGGGITIENLHLPNVSNASEFVDELRHLGDSLDD